MMTRFATLFPLLSTVVTVHAENLLAESRRAQWLPDTYDRPASPPSPPPPPPPPPPPSPDPVDERSTGGCFPVDGGNGECSGLQEGYCRLNSECEWISSCPKTADERPNNLFEQPEDKDYCWLIRDEGTSIDDARNKDACLSEGCKAQCSSSYRRSPRGNKADLCYWDPNKRKCRSGIIPFDVEPQCPFLPAASKTDCFPSDDGDNSQCRHLKEGYCRLDPKCDWFPSCPKTLDERPTNLFEQPEGKHYCWLIRDEGKSIDDAKNKDACSSKECKAQCSTSYRRSPLGNKADLCYWDPGTKNCRWGSQFIVEPQCPFLPAASKSGCFPSNDAGNSQCRGLEEHQCRLLDQACEWFPPNCPKTADERPTNLFEQPKGQDYCWLITDVGTSKADKRKGSCTTTDCKAQCSSSYRRSPRGNLANLCHWDPAEEKCDGGYRVDVQPQCPFLPAARGCLRKDGGNGECSGLKEGQCRDESECEWVSSCPKTADERPINLFDQGPNYCWLIKDEGQCDRSYRRSPHSNKARLCYWDPVKESCKGGTLFVVEKSECAFLLPGGN